MALRAAPSPVARPGGSVVPFRQRKTDRRSETPDDLRMEVRAAGMEMLAMSERITNVLAAGDSHSAMHFATRLGALGRSYLNSGGSDAA